MEMDEIHAPDAMIQRSFDFVLSQAIFIFVRDFIPLFFLLLVSSFHCFVSITFCSYLILTSMELCSSFRFFFFEFSIHIFEVKFPRHVICLFFHRAQSRRAENAQNNRRQRQIWFELSKLEMATNFRDRTICRKN